MCYTITIGQRSPEHSIGGAIIMSRRMSPDRHTVYVNRRQAERMATRERRMSRKAAAFLKGMGE